MNEIENDGVKMMVKEAIEQLNDLKRDREGFAKNDEPDSVFAYDIKAIDVAITVMEMVIDEMPTIEAEPVKCGKWTEMRLSGGDIWDYYFVCGVCHGETPNRAFTIAPDYCPNCGAKMEE